MTLTPEQGHKKKFYVNNFDLIRLFAALQVVHFHIVAILGLKIEYSHQLFLKVMGFFPGVPIFFFISGFLITRSWVGSKGLRDYFRKRALRIFPALIFSVVLALLLVVVSGYYQSADMSVADLLIVFFAKSTFFQFYNPEFLRGYGDGAINGSLWTITVELQFYILTPLVFIALHRFGHRVAYHYCLLALFVMFYLISAFMKYNFFVTGESFLEKLAKVSFIPWFYMFLLGALFQVHFDFFYRWLSGKFLWVLMAYVAVSTTLIMVFHVNSANFGNLMSPLLFPVLAALIFSAAYSGVGLSERILRGNDISYGAYIYHMPFINWLIYHNYSVSYLLAFLLFLFIVGFSVLSWKFLEQPFLKMK